MMMLIYAADIDFSIMPRDADMLITFLPLMLYAAF